MNLTLYASHATLVKDDGTPLPLSERHVVKWREKVSFEVRLPSNASFPSGYYRYAFDYDRDFMDTAPCNAGECTLVDGKLTFDVVFNSVRQAVATNGRRRPIPFYIQISTLEDDFSEYVIDDTIWVNGCVWDGRAAPSVPATNYYTKEELDALVAGKLDTPVEPGEVGYVLGIAEDGSFAWIPQAATNVSWGNITDKPDFKTVATTGDYNDLSNKPSIPAAQEQSDWNESDNTKANYIKNKPTIPAAQQQSDWNEADDTKADFIKNKPNITDYIPKTDKGVANGVSTLDSGGKVPDSELPAMDYIPSEQTGAYTGLELLVEPGKFYAWAPDGAASHLYPTINVAQGVDTSKAWISIVHFTTGKTSQISSSTISMQEGTWRYLDSSFMMWIVCDGTSVKAYRVVTRGMWTSTSPGGYGVVGLTQNGGICSGNGSIIISSADYNAIDSRSDENPTSGASNNKRNPIVPATLNYAVRSVLPNVTVIPSATTSYSLLDASATTNNHSWQYSHAPEAASTYVFPAVISIDERTHSIILDVDFTAVQTYSFEDADGNTLVPQKDITVLAGDKWRFICIYQYGTWLIYPLQLKVETVTPNTPVSITGDTATAISVQLSATASGNGILTYSATGLPAGVTCSSSGLISGTPTTAGTTTATVTVKTPYSKPSTITVNFDISAGSSTPQSLTVSGTGAQSNNFDGTYTLTNDTVNSRPVWYNSANQKYIFAVENGMDNGWFAWAVGGTPVQMSAGDTMMFYTYCTYDVQGLANLSDTPDQSTTPWYSMGTEVSSSEFSIAVTA